MLWLRGWGLTAAVGRRRPVFLIDATIRTVEESSPPAPFLPRRHTSCLNDVTCGRARRNACFGMEAAERDGSDAAGGGRSHLTGDHRQPPGTEPCEFLRRKLQRKTTNSHRRVVSRVV